MIVPLYADGGMERRRVTHTPLYGNYGCRNTERRVRLIKTLLRDRRAASLTLNTAPDGLSGVKRFVLDDWTVVRL